MLRLTIAPPHAWRPSTPDPASPVVDTWRDHDGTICAYGHILGEDCWLHLPGVGSFRFGAALPDVLAVPEPSATREQVVDAYYRTVLPFALQARGLEALHASAVRMGNGVVALCAVKETGKSTIAYALSRRGHPLWADDAVVFAASPDGAGVDAFAVPFAIRLRPASARFFGRDGAAAAAGERDGATPLELAPAPFAALCVLERAAELPADAPVEVHRLASAAAFTAALTHAYCFTLRDPRWKERTVAHYLDLVRRIPVFQVRFRAGLDTLPAIMDAIEQAVGATPPAGDSAGAPRAGASPSPASR